MKKEKRKEAITEELPLIEFYQREISVLDAFSFPQYLVSKIDFSSSSNFLCIHLIAILNISL